MPRVLRCTNPFVDEFFSLMEKADRIEGGYSYKELHSMYVEFMRFFYPNEKTLGEESIRRKLVIDGLPYIESETKSNRKKLYLIKPSSVLLEVEGIKKIVFNIKGVNLEAVKQQVKKEVKDMGYSYSYNTIYKNSDRKFESKHYKADSGSIEKFIYVKGYSLVFDKQDWVKFSDFYRDYLKFCADSVYVPLNQLTVKKYLQDATYRVIKLVESRHDSKNLYVNINNKKTSPKPKVVPIQHIQQQPTQTALDLMTKPIPITTDLHGSVEVKPVFKLELFTTLSGDFGQKVNDNVREFIHRRTSYDEDGIPYDTKKLYAAYRYYMRDKDIYSFNEFRYIISCIPAARLESDYDNNTEVSRIIPEFEYLSRMEEKNRAGLIQMQINNYYKRVTKASEEAKKIYEQLEAENGWYPAPAVVEEEKEDKDKVEELKKAELQHNIKSVGGEEQHKEASSTTIETKKVELKEDDKSLGFIDAAMRDIEHNYAGVIRRYKALESIKQVIKEERVKVHADLKPIFDMIVENSLKKFEEINPTFPSFEKEVEDLKANLRNLSNFVKKA